MCISPWSYYNVYKWPFWATQLEFLFICFPLNFLLWMKFLLCYLKWPLLYIVTVQELILMNFSSETKVSTKPKFNNQYSIHELSRLNLTYFHSPYITNPPVFTFSNCSCFSSSFKKNMTLNTSSNSLRCIDTSFDFTYRLTKVRYYLMRYWD